MGGSRGILGSFDYGSYKYVEFQHMRRLGLKCNDGAGGVIMFVVSSALWQKQYARCGELHFRSIVCRPTSLDCLSE